MGVLAIRNKDGMFVPRVNQIFRVSLEPMEPGDEFVFEALRGRIATLG